MSLAGNVRQTLTIARRDFTATVFTPVFLLFLFAPLVMLGFSAIGGLGASSMTEGATQKQRLIAIVAPGDVAGMRAADANLRDLFAGPVAPPELTFERPSADIAAQANRALDADDVDVVAVASGPIDALDIRYHAGGDRDARYLAAVAARARAMTVAGTATRATFIATQRPRSSLGGRQAAGFFAVFGIFFLTLFLSGQAVGTMAEERNNKVIEVLAAAVPLESVFLGKLLGMFGVALLFVGFWGAIAALGAAAVPAAAAPLASVVPAIGWTAFALLFAAYFTLAYLLLGSVFLGVGAQASTIREIQLLSLPITLLQVGMFGLASAAASQSGTAVSLIAEVFPLSSPYAMAGRAATGTQLWPHLLALAWQALWVAIFITIGARLFRRGVLQSGGPGNAITRLFARR